MNVCKKSSEPGRLGGGGSPPPGTGGRPPHHAFPYSLEVHSSPCPYQNDPQEGVRSPSVLPTQVILLLGGQLLIAKVKQRNVNGNKPLLPTHKLSRPYHNLGTRSQKQGYAHYFGELLAEFFQPERTSQNPAVFRNVFGLHWT